MRLLSLCLLLLSRGIFAADSGIELWYYQAPSSPADVVAEDHPVDIGGDAEITRRHDAWRIGGMSLNARALEVRTIEVISTARVRVQKRVVVNLGFTKIDKRIVLADIPNAGLRIQLRRPIFFAMPETIHLKCISHAGKLKVELTDDGKAELRRHFSLALTQFLSPRQFDVNFGHVFFNLSGPAGIAFDKVFDSKKGDLLAELRDHLIDEMMKPGYFDSFLGDVVRVFPVPAGFADRTYDLVLDRRDINLRSGRRLSLPPDTWVVRETGTFSPFGEPTVRAIGTPKHLRPAATLVVSSLSLGNLLIHAFDRFAPSLGFVRGKTEDGIDLVYYPFSATERDRMAGWIGRLLGTTDEEPTRVLALELSGPGAPIVVPWYSGKNQGGEENNSLDLWITARWIDPARPSSPQPRIGLFVVFSLGAEGQIQVRQIEPAQSLTGPGQEERSGAGAPPDGFRRSLETLVLRALVNARLPDLSLSSDPNHRPTVKIRMLGNLGWRAPGQALAEALAIDFAGSVDF